METNPHEWIRKRRDELRLTLKDVEVGTSINKSYISSMERNQCTPGPILEDRVRVVTAFLNKERTEAHRNGLVNIKDIKISEKIFKRGRWFVRLEKGYCGTHIMAYAHYVWLLYNPSFKTVPTDYIIHHLDHNKTNDDITNLVLMQRHYHVAYHLKNKIRSPKVVVEFQEIERTEYYPIKEPTIYFNKGKNFYVVTFQELIGGVKKRKMISKIDGISFKTKELAEQGKRKIWSNGD